jgi:HEAT repeat protein
MYATQFCVLVTATVAFTVNSAMAQNEDVTYQGRNVPQWKEFIKKPHVSASFAPRDSPFIKDPDPAAIPLFRAMLKDEDRQVRCYVLECIVPLKEKAEPLIDDIARCLKSRESRVAIKALRALQSADPKLRKIVPMVKPLINHEDVYTRLKALDILSVLRPTDDKHVDMLLEMFKKAQAPAEAGVYFEIIGTLARMDWSHPHVSATLKTVLNDKSHENSGGRSTIAEVFGESEENVSAKAPILKELLKDSDHVTRVEAACSLWRLTKKSPELCLPVLLAAEKWQLSNETDQKRIAVIAEIRKSSEKK